MMMICEMLTNSTRILLCSSFIESAPPSHPPMRIYDAQTFRSQFLLLSSMVTKNVHIISELHCMR